MEAYGGFAQVYDEFMDNVDYHQWCGYAVKLLKKYGVSDGQLVEIGCGTGTGTMLFAKEGYQMIGIDISQEMLEIAESKKEDCHTTGSIPKFSIMDFYIDNCSTLPIMGYQSPKPYRWHDIGKPDALEAAQRDFENDNF